VSGTCPALALQYNPATETTSQVDLIELVRREASEANRALPSLADDAVAEALTAAAALVREREALILAANVADVEAAQDRLDEGTLDRLRLDRHRVAALADQVDGMAAIPPLEREIDSWTLPNGLEVHDRRIPIGTVGANFEARPTVALDVAGQLLKSLNTAVLRTGGAALRTVNRVDASAGQAERRTAGARAAPSISGRRISRSPFGSPTAPEPPGCRPA